MSQEVETTAKPAQPPAAKLILWKPWLHPRTGQPACVPDPNGDFVAKADYDALVARLEKLEKHDAGIQAAADAQ